MTHYLEVFVQWGEMLPFGHAGWPFISCQTCGELFISKDVDLVLEGAQEHVDHYPDHKFDVKL